MALFDFLRRPKTVEDEVFSEMTKFKEPAGDVFSCSPIFGPTGLALDCIMYVEGELSTDEQKKFYRKIESEYDNILLPKIIGLLPEDIKDNDNYSAQKFSKEYELTAMDLPDFRKPPLQWTVVYLSIDKSKRDFSVSFKGYEPESIK